jgi:hypothetical protein
MPILPSDIRNVVASEDGFGHEMRVGAAIRGVPAIAMQHGGTYTDPASGKPRQFDYRCALRKEAASLSLAVECKSLSRSVALAVCGIKRRDDEAFHDLIESRKSTSGPEFTMRGWSSVTRRANREDAFYPPGEFVGKSLVRIQCGNNHLVRTPDSDIYDKWEQALSSAVELAKSACSSAKSFSGPNFFTAVLPVVVVPDDRLWKVVYDDSGSISADPSEVTECDLYVGREIEVGPPEPPQKFVFSHVHFFTLTGFRSFLSKMAVNEQAWTKLFTEKALTIPTA